MSIITRETEQKIINNNKKISKLLEENENLYLSELSDLDRRIFAVDQENKIVIPNDYIRKKDQFIEDYELNKIIYSFNHQSNIAYLMQYADLNSYFMSRFKIFGQLEKVHYYYSLINLESILEIILKEIAGKYRNICINCEIQKHKCSKIISKEIYGNLKSLLSQLNEFKIISISSGDIENLKDLIDVRNQIHIRLMTEKMYNNPKLSVDFYNKCMSSFKKLMGSINLENIKCNNN